MSFTSMAKDEISRLDLNAAEDISELSAIIQNGNIIDNYITITTENSNVAKRIYNLLKKVFNINAKISIKKGYNYNKKTLYTLKINDLKILKTLGITNNIPEQFIYSDSDLIRAYLKGLFLVCGSINDPKTARYHLEFNLNDEEYAKFISNLLNNYSLNSKVLKRENRYMVYIKEAEKISEFLMLIGASKAVLYYEDIRIYRDHKNMTNRLNNCEQANVEKSMETANKQIKDIELIISLASLDTLNEKEKQAAIYRQKYPEASLLELSEIISIETGQKISKSGLYHRFRKITETAQKLKK